MNLFLIVNMVRLSYSWFTLDTWRDYSSSRLLKLVETDADAVRPPLF